MAKRTCPFCKGKIDLIKDAKTIVFLPNKRFSHMACFKDSLIADGASEDDAEKKVQYLIPKTQSTIIDIVSSQSNKKTKKECRLGESKNPRRILTDWIYMTYGVSYLSSRFFQKLESIYKGTFQRLNKPCPPEDLLDMWIQKKPYLDKVALRNQQKGMEMSTEQRINYDLAILLSKYDDYLAWKNKMKNSQEQVQEKQPKVEYEKLNHIPASHDGKKASVILIDEFLDEI